MLKSNILWNVKNLLTNYRTHILSASLTIFAFSLICFVKPSLTSYGEWFTLLGVSPEDKWSATYGGASDDEAWCVQQTTDGGYIVSGRTYSFGSGNGDFWILKLASNSTSQWQKVYQYKDACGGYSGSGDKAYSIQQTLDGGYIVSGSAGTYWATGSWIAKLNSNGSPQWQKHYKNCSSNHQFPLQIQQTSDSGFIIGGWLEPFSGANHNNPDTWALKIDASGNKQWEKSYGRGGNYAERATSIQQTSDGGYIMAGYRGDPLGATPEDRDLWVLKLDSLGVSQWQKVWSGAYDDWAESIRQTADGGYIVAGYRYSGTYSDVWVLKLDSSGTVVWQNTYGGIYNDGARSVRQTTDGGYIVAGRTNSYGAGDSDFWILKLDSSGTVVWQKTYGGALYDEAASIEQTTDGGYIVAGSTKSFGAGGYDIWVLKLAQDGSMDPSSCGFGADTSILGISVADAITSASHGSTGLSTSPAALSLTIEDSTATANLCFVQPPCAPPEGWEVEVVDFAGDVGVFTSLAFDASGNPAISYYDNTNISIKYAHFNGTSWEDVVVDAEGTPGWDASTSLAFDPSGNPTIAHYYYNTVTLYGFLKYSHFNGASWDPPLIVDNSVQDVGGYPSLAFNPLGDMPMGMVGISYYDWMAGDLKYAHSHDGGATWETETVDSTGNVGTWTSLAFNPITGYPAISYLGGSFEDTLKYAQFDGATWIIKNVDPSGMVTPNGTSLAFDSSGNPGISYHAMPDAIGGYLMYAHSHDYGATWETEIVDSAGHVGDYSSLAFDSSGNPSISYNDETEGDLKYAHLNVSTWVWTITSIDCPGNVGEYTSIAFDPSGNPAISHYDATNGDLKYAHFVPPGPCPGSTAIAAHDINLTSYCDPGNISPVTPVDALIILGLAVGAITPDMLSPALTPAAAAIIGDGDGDGILEPVDALMALGVAVGSVPPQAPNPRCVPSSDILGTCP